MSIGTHVFGMLSIDAGVTAIVGAPPSCGVYPGVVPQEKGVPAVTYAVVGGAPAQTFDAEAQADNERVQITCWAMTYDEAVALAKAVRAALKNRDEQIARDIGIQVRAFQGSTFDGPTRRHGEIIDFSFWT